jgi:hypothetical protein
MGQSAPAEPSAAIDTERAEPSDAEQDSTAPVSEPSGSDDER